MATTENWRLADPEYVDFDPTTVQEAILKFRRLQRMGLKPWMYPEAMVTCARKLGEQEMGRFESWLINPSGEPDKNAVDVRDFLKAQHDLDVKHGRFALLPMPENDEKEEKEDDEKTQD